jgi:uncharacterized protein
MAINTSGHPDLHGGEAGPGTLVGPLQLLILQATPFCNIDCRYCYLPSRLDRRLMSLETVEAVANAVAEADLWGKRTTVVWHAGEPLVAPLHFYEDAVRILARAAPSGYRLTHTIQTNGTLVDDAWCEFFRTQNIKIGISIDGPASIHDSARVTRGGKGTFDTAVRGLRLLKKYDVPCYVLSVLTAASLDSADDMYRFYVDEHVDEVGFNVEEIEGVHRHSSLEGEETVRRFSEFMERFCELADDGPLRVRELRSLKGILLNADLSRRPDTQQLTPYRILSVDVAGDFSTFSPELLGMQGPPAGDFVLGNVRTDRLRDVLESERFKQIAAAIRAGVQMCQDTCTYFQICGGGSPSNKLSENGTFLSTETLQCRLRVKALSEVVLSRLEKQAVTDV